MPVTHLPQAEAPPADPSVEEHPPAPDPVYNCARCSHYLAPGTLACPECHTLAYGPHLNRLAAAAAQAEQGGKLVEARDLWTEALAWLPAESTQAKQVQQHLHTLSERQQTAEARQARWTKRLGPLAPLALAAAKFKSAFFLLFKLKFLLGFVGFFGLYWALYGWKFAVGFTLSILIHEMGHYVEVRRRGLKADLPMFLPGLGAYVRWYHQGLPLSALASIALAGPLFGLCAALGCAALYAWSHQPVFLALTYVGAWVNLLNLIPVLGLDGAQATYALSRLQRGLMLAACLILFTLMQEGIFLFIAAGMTYRLFTQDAPEQENVSGLAGYLALLFALGAVLYFVPNPGQLTR